MRSKTAMGAVALAWMILLGCTLAAQSGGRGTLLVLANGENQMVLLHPDSGEVLARMGTGVGPHEVVASRDGRFAYVVNSGGTTLSAFDLQKRTTLATWEIGWFTQPHTPCTMPHGLALSRDGNSVWVTCAPQKTVFEIETKTGKAVRLWNTQREGSWMLAAAPDGSKLFVPNLEGKSLSVIDRRTSKVQVVELGESAMAIDVAPNGKEVWVGGTAKVWVLDTETNAVLATIPVEGPMRLKFASQSLVVISTRTGMTLVDAVSRRAGGSIALEGVPKGLVISPDGRFGYLGLVAGTEIAVVDLTGPKLVKKVALGKTPEGLAWAK